jgi:hypothetical protein
MPEFDDLFDDDDNLSGSDLVKQLRSALKAEKRARKDEQDKLNDLLAKQRTSSLADVLKDKGLSEKAAGLYPADRDTTPEAVDAWLADFGDLFGIAKSETTATPEQQAAAQVLSSAAASAPPATSALDARALIAEIQAATTPAELAAAYEKAGLK